MGIDLGKVDPTLLFQALQALGLNPQKTATGISWYGGEYNFASKTASIRSSRMAGQNAETATAEIKRAYSGEVVKSTAKKYGWQIKETAPYQYQVVKNSY